MREITNLSETGERGLILFYDQRYFAVPEDDWRKLTKYALPEPISGSPVGALARLHAAVAVLEEAPNNVFLNLDAFADLKPTDGSQQDAGTTPVEPLPPLLKQPCVVVCEGKNVILVPNTEWIPISGDVAGDAKVLVLRGCIAANIPEQDIPTGTFCVLVNFAGLLST